VRTFRFRLARVLELRERTERDRLAALETARAALRAAAKERADLAQELGRVLDSIASAEGPGSGRARHDLILYEEHLREKLGRAERAVAERRCGAEDALAALHAAVKDRKVLARLRDKRRMEHFHEVERREQAMNDESARRLWRQGMEPPGSEFPRDRNDLPGAARSVRSDGPPRPA
jgi:flagellar export protein FliJ